MLDILRLVIGKKQNPFNPEAFRSIALVAFLAWVGLGADGLSSSCYGPEVAYLALGSHTHLALFVALATAVTVFIISLGYNQVVELFPSGGGGYKVATQLLGSYAGLISGSALIIDYVLTIAVSIASGVDALFSFLPEKWLYWRETVEISFVLTLTLLNLRGMKESIRTLLPIFMAFILSHVFLILYGIFAHRYGLQHLTYHAVKETHSLAAIWGWMAVIGLMLHSYSLGGGTYTGLEAVSNNVNRLVEPRIRTGKITMAYMAVSLSFMAAGIMLMYLLWDATPQIGKTLNAVVFSQILGSSPLGHAALIFVLITEAGILLVAANTGFLAGPMVLANMAVDHWVPKRFRNLSSRLVTQNGILFFGFAASVILLFTHGKLELLVVLYSINVFITFSLCLLGLCVYWLTHRNRASAHWIWRLIFSGLGFIVTSSILIVTVMVKFTEGGWITVVITGLVIISCLLIRRHYRFIAQKLKSFEQDLLPPIERRIQNPPQLKPQENTAVFFIGEQRSLAMHTLLWALRMFPNHFKNIIFISGGAVDIQSFSGQKQLKTMQRKVTRSLNYFVRYCRMHGIASTSFAGYGTDITEELSELARKVSEEFPNAIFFASRIIFEQDHWFVRWLHNETAITLQRRLHSMGRQLIILPMKIS